MGFAQIELITQAVDKPTFNTINGSAESFIVSLLDADGAAIDLTPYMPEDGTPTSGTRSLPITTGAAFAVSSYMGQASPDVNRAGEIYGTPTEGKVLVNLTASDLTFPGLYIAEISLIADGVMEQAFLFYVESAASLQWTYSGPITIAEVRLWSRDHSPEVNDLLDEVEFKDTEVIAAIRRGVDMWNSTPPMLTRHTYTALTFPQAFRSQWIDVTISFLKDMAADWYDRNHLDYAAGGLTVQDRNKGKVYREDALRRMALFQQWMGNVKRQLNLNGAWGGIGYGALP